MAKAKYFTQNKEKIYPISHTKAVYDGNGKVLEDRLTEDETAISSLQTDVKGKADKTDVDNKLSSNSAISDTTVAFTEASARENIVSNEKSSTLFGKVQKWFSDLKKVAFTGSYSDLIDTPSNATSDADGLMSKEDKSTVDSLDSTFLDTSSAKYNFLNLLKWNSSNNKIVEIDNRTTPVYYGGNEIVSFNDLPDPVNEQYDGLMLSTDKIKLDGIATNANNYVHPTTAGNKHIPSGGSSGQILKWSADGTAIWGTEKTYSNATTSSSGLMSASDKIDLDACVETLSANASMFLSSIKSPAPAEFEFDETLSLSNLTVTGDVVFSDTGLFNGYASLTEITSNLNDILQKNVDNGFDFVGNLMHYNPGSGIRFDFTSSDPVYLNTGSNKTGKWYYDGNELATKSDIPSTSDFLKTSGGTMTGTYTLTSGYSINSSSNSNLKLIRVDSKTNYFGEQAAADSMYNYFGYRNNTGTIELINYFGGATSQSYRDNLNNHIGRYSKYNYVGRQTGSYSMTNYFGYRSGSTTTGLTNYFGSSYSSSYKNSINNYIGRYATTNYIGELATTNWIGNNATNNYFCVQSGSYSMTNYFGYRNGTVSSVLTNNFGTNNQTSYKSNLKNYFGTNADVNHFGDGANNSYYRGDTIYLGDSTSHPVYMQGSTSYKVVGTTTGYNTKVHVASSQPSNMSVGDIWFKIPS